MRNDSSTSAYRLTMILGCMLGVLQRSDGRCDGRGDILRAS